VRHSQHQLFVGVRPLFAVRGDSAGLWARILRAVCPFTIAVLVLAASSALAQENRGTEQQRVACALPTLIALLRAYGGKNLS
jgi:hypothetical protein